MCIATELTTPPLPQNYSRSKCALFYGECHHSIIEIYQERSFCGPKMHITDLQHRFLHSHRKQPHDICKTTRSPMHNCNTQTYFPCRVLEVWCSPHGKSRIHRPHRRCSTRWDNNACDIQVRSSQGGKFEALLKLIPSLVALPNRHGIEYNNSCSFPH